MSRRWGIILIAVLIEGLSGFGRTASFSPFLKDLVRDLSLTMVQISTAYGLANLVTGIALPYIGKQYDRWPVASFLRFFISGFGGAFLAISLLAYLKVPSLRNWIVLGGAFIAIRMAVQAYMLTVRCLVSAWFTQHRSFATGISTFFLASIASAMPWLSVHIHNALSWYHFWLLLGVLWLGVMLPLAKKVHKPDLSAISAHSEPAPKGDRAFLKNPAFWLLMAALFFKAFQNTGVAFHLIPICQEYGASEEHVTRILALTPLITLLTVFMAGYGFEKWCRIPAVGAFLLLDLALLTSIPFLTHPHGIILFGLLAGAYWGMRQIIAYLVIPKLFGITCIGAVNGWASACICLGSATGPYCFAYLHASHSYHFAVCACQVVAMGLLGVWMVFRKRFDVS